MVLTECEAQVLPSQLSEFQRWYYWFSEFLWCDAFFSCQTQIL